MIKFPYARVKAFYPTLAILGALAACGNSTPEDAGRTPAALLLDNLRGVAGGSAARTPALPKPTIEQAAAEALRVNPSPLIQVGFESLGRTQIMAMTGQNGAMRTYMTPSEETLILRDGILIGTRGLGNDLSVAEAQLEAAIRSGASGQGNRIMRYYASDGLERPLQFACTTKPGPSPAVLVESCEGHGIVFQNSYLIQGGSIPVSRQWIGPTFGYVTIQTLRP